MNWNKDYYHLTHLRSDKHPISLPTLKNIDSTMTRNDKDILDKFDPLYALD